MLFLLMFFFNESRITKVSLESGILIVAIVDLKAILVLNEKEKIDS